TCVPWRCRQRRKVLVHENRLTSRILDAKACRIPVVREAFNDGAHKDAWLWHRSSYFQVAAPAARTHYSPLRDPRVFVFLTRENLDLSLVAALPAFETYSSHLRFSISSRAIAETTHFVRDLPFVPVHGFPHVLEDLLVVVVPNHLSRPGTMSKQTAVRVKYLDRSVDQNVD